MDTTEIMVVVTAILALGVSIFVYFRSGREFTPEGVQEIAYNAGTLAAELRTVAQVAVAAAQQLKESGQINSSDEAFDHAVQHIETWYNGVAPDIELDPAVVANAIESAYYWLRKAYPTESTQQ